MELPKTLTPRSERVALISKNSDASKESSKLHDFRGQTITLPLIRLPIETPVYRMENGRTFSEQADIVAKEKLAKDHFEKGQELLEVQRVQHKLLSSLANKGTSSVAPIIDELRKDGQRDPILITHTGIVVNGNRRLAALRELAKDSSEPSTSYAYVDCMVLPSDTSPEEIDDIELNLQGRKQTKLDYDWIGTARLIIRQIERGRKPLDIAKRMRLKETEVKLIQKSMIEAELYLKEWLDRPGELSLVSGDAEQFFTDLSKQLAKTPEGLENASRAIAWTLFTNRKDVPGRLYNYTSTFGELTQDVLDIVSESLEMEDLDDEIDIDLPENAISEEGEDFFIDFEEEAAQHSYVPIIEALKNPDTKDEATTVVIQACQSVIEKKKEQKSEKAALSAIKAANSKLASVNLKEARPDDYVAIRKQLDNIAITVSSLQSDLTKLES